MLFKEQANTKEGEILINMSGSLQQHIGFTKSALAASGCPLKRSPCGLKEREAWMHSDKTRSDVSVDGNIFSSTFGAFNVVVCCYCCCKSGKSSENQKVTVSVAEATWSWRRPLLLNEAPNQSKTNFWFVYAIGVPSSIVPYNYFQMNAKGLFFVCF